MYLSFEDMSTWSVHTELGRQGIFVNVTSLSPAKFSVQLCKLNQRTCTPVGQIYSLNIVRTFILMFIMLYFTIQPQIIYVTKLTFTGTGNSHFKSTSLAN